MHTYPRKSVSKKARTWLLVAIIVLPISFFVVKYYLDLPHDLGPDLVYIGKQDYGNIPFISDSRPGSTLYFGTDMTYDELKAYFERSGYRYLSEGGGGVSARYRYRGLMFSSSDNHTDDMRLTVEYYDNNVASVVISKHLEASSKAYVMGLDVQYYQQLRQALRGAGMLK